MSINIPAEVGMSLEEVLTPCLLLDLDAFEGNVKKLADFARKRGLRVRPHAKTHKSANIAHYQMAHGAVGVCCQKVSEAEALVDGGVPDVLVSNQVVQPQMINRLAALARQARVQVCVDDYDNIAELSKAAQRFGSTIEVLVEIDVGGGRCGVEPGEQAVKPAQRVSELEGLTFSGLQAYYGGAQHIRNYTERGAKIDYAVKAVTRTIKLMEDAGLECKIISGAGTGTYEFEGGSGVYNELQCGSYVFMDADYQRNLDARGLPTEDFENSLFIYTTIMSKTKREKAVCDAGLKVQSVDSGLPVIFGREDLEYTKASDEHGDISDPDNTLRVGEKLRLVPGHCDPTVNVHDWLVGIRNGRVERLWPVTARGMCL